MKQILGLIAAMALSLPAVRAADYFAPFSWDHVPVYAHVGKTSGDFTPEQLDFLAKHFNFITIEKDQASHKYGCTEEGFAAAARAIKKRNPKAKVLFYWNASLDTSSHRGSYKAMQTFPADGFLTDSHGKTVKRRGAVPNYDLARKDVRDWWSDAAAKAVSRYGADGIFADAMGQRRDKRLGDKKLAELVAARVDLLKETRQKIGPDKLIIYNGLMKDDPKKLLQFADGAMIESFDHPKYGDSKEILAAYFKAARRRQRGQDCPPQGMAGLFVSGEGHDAEAARGTGASGEGAHHVPAGLFPDRGGTQLLLLLHLGLPGDARHVRLVS